MQKNVLFSGKASVINGEFEFEFIMPKDINYALGNGKISYYATDGIVDATGFDNSIIIGGTSNNTIDDNDGPDVDLFLEDEDFVFGGLTNGAPLLIVNLFDENGINTSGNGIGHDITAVLDGDNSNTIVLNDFYEGELDEFRAGKVLFPLEDLEPGLHTLSVKAWDVLNNSGEGLTEFIVAESAELALKNVFNYPNPFTTNTLFMFEHNRPGDALEIDIEIFTISGKMIKSIQEIKVSSGFRVNDIRWDGLDDYGDRIGRGVYIYKVSVRDTNGSAAEKFQKLVLLR